jgi:hypothetical protein
MDENFVSKVNMSCQRCEKIQIKSPDSERPCLRNFEPVVTLLSGVASIAMRVHHDDQHNLDKRGNVATK